MFYLEQLAILVSIIKQHVRMHTGIIFKLVQDKWDNVSLQLPLVSLVESLGRALDAEFKPYLPMILPHLLKAFDGELNDKTASTQRKILEAFQTFGTNIEEYLQLVIPVIVKTYERPDAAISLRKTAAQTIESLTRRVNFSDHASRIVLSLTRALNCQSHELKMAVMDTLSALVIQLGSDFAVFIPTVEKVSHEQHKPGTHVVLLTHESRSQALRKNRVSHAKYSNLITKLLDGERLPQDSSALDLLYEICTLPSISPLTPG